MDLIRRQAPARAALLLATTLLLACNGNPAATETEVSTSGTKKVSKATPRPTASAPAAAGGSTSPTTKPSTAASTATGASTAPTTSTAPSTATSVAPSAATSTAPTTSPSPSSGGSGGGASPVTSTAPTTNPSATPLPQQATPGPGAVTVGTYAGTDTAGFDDGAVATATFNNPRGLAVHASTGDVYVADTSNHAIRKISNGGQVTTMIGTGEATTPQDTKTLNNPQGVAVMTDGTLLIADTSNNRIRKLRAAEAAEDFAARELDFVVGGTSGGFADGVADASRMNGPTGIALSEDQKFLWVVDSGNNCIRIVDLAADSIETLAGSSTESGTADGTGTVARFNNPTGCAAVGNDTLYVVDAFNSKLRKIVKSGNAVTVSTVASATLSLFTPADVLASGTDPEGAGGSLLIADGNLTIQRLAGGELSAVDLIPAAEPGFADGGTDVAKFKSMADLVVHPSGAILVADPQNNRIRKLIKP